MLISHLGEVELIKRISLQFSHTDERVLRGIGDDAALLSPPRDRLILVTKDLLLEGVHFLTSYISPYQLGKKALAVNISDISAMGGVPRHLVTALGVSPDMELERVEEIYRGMGELCRTCSINLIGGDTIKSPQGLILSITLLGEVEKDCPVFRTGARPGDLIGVTGYLGSSAAGLDILKGEIPGDKKGVGGETSWSRELINSHLEPPLRLQEARLVAQSHLATSMIDLSDGLIKDLGEIARASGVGARIYLDRIPLSPFLKEASSCYGWDPLEYALGGGEDYELLFTFKKEDKQSLEKVAESFQVPLTTIGEITSPGEGIKFLDSHGQEREFSRKGYTHF